MSTDDILDAIDHALRDVELGADAMRWSPEEPAWDAKDPSGYAPTDVLVGREEHPMSAAEILREREAAGARYRAALAADAELREDTDLDVPSPSICPAEGEHSAECRRNPCGRAVSEGAQWEDAQRLSEEYIARLYDVPVDVVLRTFGACACPESGHVPTCVMRAVERRGAPLTGPVTHSDPGVLAEHVERARRHQGSTTGRTEGARETYSVLDEIRRWSTDPRSPIARAGHDFTRPTRSCSGCQALLHVITRGVLEDDPTFSQAMERHGHWLREHEYVEHEMYRAGIPLRGGDPLPYYRALWRNAERDSRAPIASIPYCRMSTPERGAAPALLLGGSVPWDGSVLYVVGRLEAINVTSDYAASAWDVSEILSPTSVRMPTDTYTAHRYRYRYLGQNWTEVFYLCRMSTDDARPIVEEALGRGYIGPRAWEGSATFRRR